MLSHVTERPRRKILADLNREFSNWEFRMAAYPMLKPPTEDEIRDYEQRIADLMAELDAPPSDPSIRPQYV